MASDKVWAQKEKRELFCKCVNSFIIKCGADKDPIMEEVIKECRKAIDSAFEYAPPEEEEQPTNFDFPPGSNDPGGKVKVKLQ